MTRSKKPLLTSKPAHISQVRNIEPGPGEGVEVYSVCRECRKPVKLSVYPEYVKDFENAAWATCSICKEGSRWTRVEEDNAKDNN